VCISVAGEGYGFGCDVADSLTGECKKTGKILASFVDPRQAFGPDKIIPPQILANAKVRVEPATSAPQNLRIRFYLRPNRNPSLF
jgi:hypothetical protein